MNKSHVVLYLSPEPLELFDTHATLVTPNNGTMRKTCDPLGWASFDPTTEFEQYF